MKQIVQFTLIVSAFCIALSCSNDATPSQETTQAAAGVEPDRSLIIKTGWLLGAWKSESPDGTAYEVWRQENDNTFAGVSFLVKGKDTMPAETIKLQQTGTELYYIPTVRDQNGNNPVSFKLSAAHGDSLMFENPGHDFPQKISYVKMGADSLLAIISGNMNGQPRAISFPMSRVN